MYLLGHDGFSWVTLSRTYVAHPHNYLGVLAFTQIIINKYQSIIDCIFGFDFFFFLFLLCNSLGIN